MFNLFKKKTVASITASISKKVDQLENLSVELYAEAARLSERSSQIMLEARLEYNAQQAVAQAVFLQSSNMQEEAAAAKAAADKIANLIN